MYHFSSASNFYYCSLEHRAISDITASFIVMGESSNVDATLSDKTEHYMSVLMMAKSVEID